MTDHELLLSFIAGLTLCDHMGDVSDDIVKVLKLMGEDIAFDELRELADALRARGVKTLYGTDP